MDNASVSYNWRMEFEERLRDRDTWEIGDRCSVARVMELLSTRTAFLVVRECLYGTTRFEDFVDRIDTSAPAVSRALKQLEAAGIITRVPYQEPGRRVRDEYRLTAAGRDLLPVILSMMHWGDAHLQEKGAPLTLVDRRTGRPVRVVVTADDVRPIEPDDIEIRYTRQPLK